MRLTPEPTNQLPPGRADEVEDLVDAIGSWAAEQADMRAVALAGSWARGSARPDSDVDIVLLTVNPGYYIRSQGWAPAFGAKAVTRTEQWGVMTERRLTRPSGLEVDVGVVAPGWAAVSPLDAGTAEVAADGLVAIYDPHGLLARLLDAVEASARGGQRP